MIYHNILCLHPFSEGYMERLYIVVLFTLAIRHKESVSDMYGQYQPKFYSISDLKENRRYQTSLHITSFLLCSTINLLKGQTVCLAFLHMCLLLLIIPPCASRVT